MIFLSPRLIVVIAITFALSCTSCTDDRSEKHEQQNITEKVDATVTHLNTVISPFEKIATLDHHRMAKAAGVYTPPSIATIFSDPQVNTPLIATNQLIGLDLPFKILSYAEPDTSNVRIAFTSPAFIQKRHGLEEEDLSAYSAKLNEVVERLPQELLSTTNIDAVSRDYGIVKIQSDFDFETTVQNLRDIVLGQSDTKWFGDIDYQKQASADNVALRPTMLLLFGGPAPGGKAMVTSPKIGLDAFCQKLLVYEAENQEVWIAYNDIVAFAELYYQTATEPQKMINQRLKMTFTKAVTIQPDA